MTNDNMVPLRAIWLMYGFRYALGRKTYCVGDVADALIEHRALLTDDWRHQIIEDIRNAIAEDMAGAPSDVRRWEEVAKVMA